MKISEYWTKGNIIRWPDICWPKPAQDIPFCSKYPFFNIHLYMIWHYVVFLFSFLKWNFFYSISCHFFDLLQLLVKTFTLQTKNLQRRSGRWWNPEKRLYRKRSGCCGKFHYEILWNKNWAVHFSRITTSLHKTTLNYHACSKFLSR